jgi:hypothetical protein
MDSILKVPLPTKLERKTHPMSRKATLIQKPLDDIQNLITADQPKRKHLKFKLNTVDQITNSLLMQMVTSKSVQYSNQTLELMGEILYHFGKDIASHSDPLKALNSFLDNHRKDHCRNMFKTSPTTLNKTLNNISPKTADNALNIATAKIEENLKKQGLWAKETILAFDPNHTRYFGNRVNRFHNWGSVGQKPTYYRTFKEVAVYASTPQLILSGSIEPVLRSDKRLRGLPVWLIDLQSQVTKFHAAGTNAKCIYGDREFYSSLAMAYSYLGLWDPTNGVEGNPRFIVPKKMWGDKELDKFSYLLDSNSPEIKLDFVELDYYYNKFFGTRVDELERKGNGTRYLVPTWSVAVFDTYGNGKKHKSLEWGKKEATRIHKKIQDAEKNKVASESQYSTFIKQHNLTKSKVPTYRGKKRSIFNSELEKELYMACWAAHNSLKYWESKKTDLCKRLIFFSISARPGDCPEKLEKEFEKLAEGYHERWGVESAFKDIQYKFHIKTNSRKPNARHIRFVLSALIYNAWHYYRLLRISRILKRKRKKWKPYHSGILPRRKKYERKYGLILDAGCFTHQILKQSLLTTLRFDLAII